MRKSVEHLGPQHEVVDILVGDSIMMRVCPDFELRRFEFMRSFLASHGSLMLAKPFDYKYPSYDIGGRCYDQAREVAINCNMTYCEGVMFLNVMGKQFPLPHAWCVTQSGVLVDPTAHRIQHKPDVLYYGVKFKTDYALSWKNRYGFHGMLDGHPELGDSVGVYADPEYLWRA